MTPNEKKQLTLQALANMKGDDLYRARAAFKHLTPQQMDAPWGANTQTPRQILAEYEQHEKEVNEAIQWVKGL